jgi:hypothetical protein
MRFMKLTRPDAVPRMIDHRGCCGVAAKRCFFLAILAFSFKDGYRDSGAKFRSPE